MATPYVGEIRLFAGNFAPEGWAMCAGQTVQISQNPVLFQLIGTTYGGDGVSTFQLPDLRSRVPVHQGTPSGGSTYPIGMVAGQETVTLNDAQMPRHTHSFATTSSGQVQSPANAFPATINNNGQANITLYGNGNAKPTTLAPSSIKPSAGGQPHENIQPYVCLTFIISLYGIYPSQS
jgi:microcystin-dependent protein